MASALATPKLKLIKQCSLSSHLNNTEIIINLFGLAGSMLDFEGDACVNAANEGGVTGFGIDELVNRAGGLEMKEARRAFNGIPTGQAKCTSSFNHKKVKHVIHAVGPVFRENSMSTAPLEVKYKQLKSAYENSMKIASDELGCDSVAFCLISAGVFRGSVPLETVIGLGIEGILDFYRNRHNDDEKKKVPTKICICAFTLEEQQALAKVLANF